MSEQGPLPWDSPWSNPAKDIANGIGAPVFGERPDPEHCCRRGVHCSQPCDFCGATSE